VDLCLASGRSRLRGFDTWRSTTPQYVSPKSTLQNRCLGLSCIGSLDTLDVDIRGFFDNMSHEWTLKCIEHRVADRRVLRLIQK
jgi:hypothetical protein